MTPEQAALKYTGNLATLSERASVKASQMAQVDFEQHAQYVEALSQASGQMLVFCFAVSMIGLAVGAFLSSSYFPKTSVACRPFTLGLRR